MSIDIVGHQKQRALLQAIAKKEFFPQSYLFVGPQGVGKKQVAREFAHTLIQDPRAPSSVDHPDLLVVCPEGEKTQSIAIEAVRKIQLYLSRFPSTGKRRVVILDEAEKLTIGAANALLKILEEPHATSILILITHQPGSLPETLLSRLTSFSFNLVPESELRAHYTEQALTLETFFFSLGLPSLIARATQDQVGFDKEKKFLRSLFQLSKLSYREKLSLANLLALEGDEREKILNIWLTGLHRQIFQETDASLRRERLLLVEKVLVSLTPLLAGDGNTRLVLEKMLLQL